jgi:predicted RND superfamily exporter protein
MKFNFKMDKLAGAGALVLVILLLFYVFLILGKTVLALVAFLVAVVVTLGALFGVGRRHPKDRLI